MTKARELSDYTGLQGDLALKSTVASPVFTGNVGIGTSSPNKNGFSSSYAVATLQGTFGGAIELTDGTTNNAIWSQGDGLTIDADKGDADGSSYMRLRVDGNEAMRIDSLGNVGIGVTPEAWSTTGVVQVGRVSLTGTPSAIGGSLNWNAYYNSGWKYKDSLQAGSMTLDNGIFTFKVAPSGTADSAISWTTAMTIDNAGIVTKPLQPAFMASGVVTANLPISTAGTILAFNEAFDQGSDFASNTFTAPVTGKYQLQYSLRIDDIDTAAAWVRPMLVTSNRVNSDMIKDPGVLSSDPEYWSFSMSILTDMDAGDTAVVKWGQSSGAAQADFAQGSFSGYLVA